MARKNEPRLITKRKGSRYWQTNFKINGKPYRVSTQLEDEVAATLWAKRKKDELLGHAKVSPEEQGKRRCLQEAIEYTYINKWIQNEDSKRTRARALKLVELLGNKPLGEFSQEDTTKLINTLLSRWYKEATVNRYIACFHTVFMVNSVFCPRSKKKLNEEQVTRIMSEAEEMEIIEILKQSGKQEMIDLCIILADTGIRVGEAVRLTKYHVDLLIERLS